MFKKLLAGLLALCLALTLLPLTPLSAHAAEPTVEGDLIKSASFRWKDPLIIEKDEDKEAHDNMRNVVWVTMKDNKADGYTYAVKFGDGQAETQATDVKYNTTGNTAYWDATEALQAATTPGDIKTMTVTATKKDEPESTDRKTINLVKLTLHKTIEEKFTDPKLPNEGEALTYPIYAVGGDTVYFLPKLQNKSGEGQFDNHFLGWSTTPAESGQQSVIKSIPSSDTDLYPVFGKATVTSYQLLEKLEDTSSKYNQEVTADYGEADVVHTFYMKNTGNTAISLIRFSGSKYFNMEISTYNDATYDKATDFYSLPKYGSYLKVDLKLKKGINAGSYSDTIMVLNSTSYKYAVILSLTVKAVDVEITPASMTKEYGKTIRSTEFNDTNVKVENSDLKFSDLGVTISSTGLSPSAAVSDTGYGYEISGTPTNNNVTVSLSEQGEQNKITVTKATPTTHDVSATSVKQGEQVSQSTLNGTFHNKNNQALFVTGTLKWTNPQAVVSTSESAEGIDMDWTFTPDDTTNYNEVHGKVKVVVSRLEHTELRLKNGETTHQTVEYDGNPHTLELEAIRKSSTGEDIIVTDGITTEFYKVVDGHNQPVNQIVDAGEYVVKAHIDASETNAADDETFSLLVTQRVIQVSYSAQDKTFNGTDATDAHVNVSITNLTNRDSGQVTVSASGRFDNDGNAGSNKTVTITLNSISGIDGKEKNYTLPTVPTVTTTANINPKPLSVTQKEKIQKPYGKLLEYADLIGYFTFTGFVGSDDVNDINVNITSAGTAAEAEVKDYNDLSVTFTAQNYRSNGATTSLGLSVIKATPELTTAPTPGTGKAGNKLSTVHLNPGIYTNPNDESLPVEGTFTWTNGDVTLEDGTHDYEWTFTLSEAAKSKYNAPDKTTGTVSVAATLKDPIDIELTGGENVLTVPYNGEAHTLTFTTKPEDAVVTISYTGQSTGSTEAPVDADVYTVTVTAEPDDEIADDYATSVETFILHITAIEPSHNTPVLSALEGTPIGDVTIPENTFYGAKNETVEGNFSWDSGSATITKESETFGWSFTPTSKNYVTITGSFTVTMAEDTRKVSAEIFNLPDVDHQDYALVKTDGLKVGDVVIFSENADGTNPIGETSRLTAEELAGNTVQVLLDSDALGDSAGTLYVKIEGMTTTATVVEYPAELGFTLSPGEVRLMPTDETTVTLTPSDESYGDLITDVKWNIADSDRASVKADGDTATSATVTGISATTTTLTATVTFDHPDKTRSESIVVTNQISVSVTRLWAVNIDKLENGSITSTPNEGKGGEKITLTVKPDEGYKLTEGSLKVTKTDGTEVKVENDNTFILPKSDVTVTAKFEEIPVYTVTINDMENGTVKATPEEGYAGTVISLVPEPDEGYHLVENSLKVTDESGEQVTLENHQFKLPASNVTVSAEFAENQKPVYTVTLQEHEGGVITANPMSGEEGTTVTVSITANDGYAYKDDSLTVTRNDTSESVTVNNMTFTLPAANVTVTAEFEKLPVHNVNLGEMTNGSVTATPASGWAGTVITLTPVPESGYAYVEGSMKVVKDSDKSEIELNEHHQFTMPDCDVTVTAEFEDIPDETYTVTVGAMENGTLTTNPSSGTEGTEITVTPVPNDGYRYVDGSLKVTAEDETEVTVNGLTFTLPASNVTVTASFEKIPVYNVTVAKHDHGTITVSKESGYAGDEITVALSADEGYMYKDGSLKVETADGESVEVADSKFTLPASDVTVSAEFLEIPAPVYTVTTVEPEHGVITATPASGRAGDKITLTLTPDKGYVYVEGSLEVKADSGEKVELDGYTFTLPASNVTVTAKFEELPPETYTVTVAFSEHGSVSASPASGHEGDKITLTVTPDEGYALDKLTVTDESGKRIHVTHNTFTLPASDVTVTATFRLKSTGGHSGGGFGGAVTPPVTTPSETVVIPEKPENGGVTISDNDAATGQTVSLTPDPTPGYWTGTVTVLDANGNAVTVTRNEDGTYSFVMPEALPVSVRVTFDKVVAASIFPDLKADAWYAEYVDYAVATYIFKGTADGKFHPEGTTTRAEVMTILARLDGKNVDGGSPWYKKAVDWAMGAGVSDGTNPTNSISREEVVTMLWRAAGEPASQADLVKYADLASVDSWALEAMRWAVENGIIQGKPGDLLDPSGTCTRAELAKMLVAMERLSTAG